MTAYTVTKEYIPSVFDRLPTFNPGDRIIRSGSDWKVTTNSGIHKATIGPETFSKIHKLKDGISIMKEIGTAIYKARTAKGWTQEELATRTGASRQYINRIESGKAFASFEQIIKIVEAMGCEFKFDIVRKWTKKEVTNEQ